VSLNFIWIYDELKDNLAELREFLFGVFKVYLRYHEEDKTRGVFQVGFRYNDEE
jgi:hypothetical protein